VINPAFAGDANATSNAATTPQTTPHALATINTSAAVLDRILFAPPERAITPAGYLNPSFE
jgi:hypothetical protein